MPKVLQGPETKLPDFDSVSPLTVNKATTWLSGFVILILASSFLFVLIRSENMQWEIVWLYLFDREILAGVGRTLMLTFLSMGIGLATGMILAVMRLSKNSVAQAVSWVWIWFFRGVPPLVQLIFWYNFALLFPRIVIGIPFGPEFISWNTNDLISPMIAAILGLAFTESAYAAEMFRAGIQAVGVGQTEAAATLGMTRLQILRRIVVPQAIRIVIPPIGNDTISMLKFTSLVSVLAMPDLLYTAQVIYTRTYQTIPLLLVASIWYLFLTTVFTIGEHYVERSLRDDNPIKLPALGS